MIKRISERQLLCPRDLKPLQDDFTVIGVFNPGAVKVKDEIVLLVRIAEQPCEIQAGCIGLPWWDTNGQIVVDWTPDAELDRADRRVVRRRSDDSRRLTSLSHLRVFRSQGNGLGEWMPGACFLPASPMEEFGIEDPRIVEIDATYWITYVAVSRHGAATSLASTRDFVNFDRHGVVFCPENKDVVLFPQKINGEYCALHRPNPNSHFGRPEIWLARSRDLLHWGQHECIYGGSAAWEGDRVGAGAPPVLLEEGWLVIYHGSRRADRPGEVGTYSAGALLLDRDNPARILRRSHEPIMQPTADFERSGFVDDIVFPTAVIAHDDTLSVYYGAADTRIGVVEFSQQELLSALHRTE